MGLERLHFVSGGVILELERGMSLWFEEDGMGGYISPPGEFSTLVENMDGTFTRTFTDGYECHFNSSGRLTACVDRNGNSIEFGYNGSGKLISITDANNLSTSFDYTGGLVTSITDPAMRETVLAYTSGRLTSITDPDEALWEYEYDSSDRLTNLINPCEFEWVFVYGAGGRIEQVNRPDETEEALVALQTIGLAGPTEGTTTNPADSVLFVEAAADYTDGRGHHWLTRLDFGGFGYAVERIDALDYITITQRDAEGMPMFVRDAEEFRTRYFHDEEGNVVRRIDPDDFEELFEYNGFSQVTEHTLRDGNFWRFEYDTDGNLTDVIWPDADDLESMPNLENNRVGSTRTRPTATF
jgi:YD repeat-containing protein